MDAMANTAARGDSLQEELTRQWDLVDVDDRIRRAGYVLIDWVDDDGYIREPMETIGEHLPADLDHPRPPGRPPHPPATPRTRRHLPPATSRNAWLLQIDAWERDKHVDLTVPRVLVTTYLHDLEMNRLPQIARKSGFTIEQINSRQGIPQTPQRQPRQPAARQPRAHRHPRRHRGTR